MPSKQPRSVQPSSPNAAPASEEVVGELDFGDNSQQTDKLSGGSPLDQATSGPPDPLPHLAALEKSFGASLGHLKAYTGQPGILAMNAKAASRGDDVVFAEEDPDLETVAEEVAHTFQPSTGGQAVSDPRDDSEDEAKDAARRVARGEAVDPDALDTPGAETQRFFLFGAAVVTEVMTSDLVQSDYDGPFEWDGEVGEAPDLPRMSLVQHWSGPTWVITDEDEAAWVKAREAGGQSTDRPTTHDGVPVVTQEDHEAALETHEASRTALVDTFVKALDDHATVSAATRALDEAVKEAQAQEEGGVPLGALQGEPRIFGHARMADIQRVQPEWLVGFAEGFDPIPQLKRILRGAEPGSDAFWAELTAWCQANPTQAQAATADAEVVELIKAADSTLGAVSAGLEHTDDRLDAEQEESPLDVTLWVDEGFTKLGKGIIGGLHAMSSDESGDQMQILQLLMSGGVMQEDPKLALDRALADHDAKAFLEAWNPLVRDQARLDTFRADPMFLIRVEDRLGKGVADRVRLDMRSGVDLGAEGELSEGERQKIREISTRTAGRLTKLIGGLAYGYGADDTAVMGNLRSWGDAVRAELQDETGQVEPPRKLQAQVILHRAFKDFSGYELCDRLHEHISRKPYSEAITIVGAQSEVLEAETLSNTTLNTEIVQATTKAAGLLSTLITPVWRMWSADDGEVLDIIRAWRDAVAEGSEDLEDPTRALLEAQSLLHAEFTKAGNKDLSERLHSHLDADNYKTACGQVGDKGTLRSALNVEGGGDSDTITAAEQDRIDIIVRNTAKVLYDELSETYTDDSDVLAALLDMQSQLREALAPAETTGETMAAYQAKVEAACAQINTAYLAFGNLEEELADHVWDSATRRKCQMISGTREVPADPELMAAILEASLHESQESEGSEDAPQDGPDASALAAELTALQQQAYALAEAMDKALQKRNPDGDVSALASMLAALGKNTELEITDLQRTQLLESAFLSVGGDLGLRIQQSFSDPAKAEAVTELLGLNALEVSRAEKDPVLLAQYEMLKEVHENLDHYKTGDEEEDAGIVADQESVRKEMARFESQIIARQRLSVVVPRLFDAIETSKTVEQGMGIQLVERAAKAIGGVEHAGDAPLVEQDGDFVPDRSTSLVATEYTKLGITLEQHLGMLPKFAQDLVQDHLGITCTPVVTTAVPFALTEEGDVYGAMVTGIEEDLQADVERLNSSKGFDAQEGLKRAIRLHDLIQTAHHLVRGEPYEPATWSDYGSAGLRVLADIVTVGGYEIANSRHAAIERAKADVYGAVADELGMDGDAQVVRKAFQELFGVSIEFSLRAAFGASSATAESMTDMADRAERTFTDQVLRKAAAKQTDEIYSLLFEASDEDKQEVLGNAAALNALRALGRKPYDRIVRTLKNELTLKDMMRSRDGDSDDYDWMVTEMWGKTKRKLGFGEDVEAMQADVAMFLAVWKEKAEKQLPDAGDDEALKKAQQEQVSAQFKQHCMEILEDEDLRALFENSLSERDRNKMLLLIADGGELSSTHQVMVDVTGSGTDGEILDHIKAMKDAERAAAVKDPTFMMRVMHDLTGADLELALAYLHGTKANDGLVDAQHTLDDQGMFGADVNAAVSDVIGMDKDALLELSKDPVAVAKLVDGIGATGTADSANADGTFDDQAQLLLSMMTELRTFEEREEAWESEANARDLERHADADGTVSDETEKQITDRNGAIAEHRDWLRIQHKYALLNASFGGAEDLISAAQAAFSERGELTDPADEDVTLYVWNQAARDQLWAEVGPQIDKTWGRQKVSTMANLADAAKNPGNAAIGGGAAAIGFLTGGLTLTVAGAGGLAYGMADSADDMDGNAIGGTWGTVIEEAVKGITDPTVIKIAKQQEFSRDDEGIAESIAAAGSELVIEDWSNIEREGPDGSSLKEVAEAWFIARAEYEAAREGGDEERAAELREDSQLARLDYVSFTVEANARVESFLRDQWKSLPWITGASDAQMLTYREAVLDRILALSPEEIAAHLGLGSFVEDEVTGTQTFERADDLELGGHAIRLDEGDIHSLMNSSRTHRAKGAMMKEKVDHQVDDWSLVDTYSDKKSGIGASYADYKVEYYKAISQTEEEKAKGDVGDITDDEAKELEPLLAQVGTSIDDYKAEKTKLADRLKMVVATVVAAITALVSGPAGPSLVMSLVLAGAEAGAGVLIDEICQGNDFDLAREALPAIATAVGEELLTHGMDQAFDGLKNAWPKQAAYLKDNPFVNFLGDMKSGVEGLPGGELLLEALNKGVVAPAVDAATAPLLHLIDPNELKWGTTSASQEAWQLFQSKVAGLPKEMWVKTVAALKDGGKQMLVDALLGKKDDKETEDLPGVKVDEKKLPKPANLWKSFLKSAGEQKEAILEGATWKDGELRKDLLTFLVETGAVVLESGDPGQALTDQLAGSKVGKTFATVDEAMAFFEEGYQGDNLAGDLFDVLYPHFDAIVKGTAKDYAKAKRKVAVHEYLRANPDKVTDLELPDGVDLELAQAFFADYLENDSKGMAVSDADFKAFQSGRWKEIQAKLQVVEMVDNGVLRRAYKDWLLEDVESFDERVTQRSAFEENFKKGQEHIANQRAWIQQDSMGDDEKVWAWKMLSRDKKDGDLFDFATGKGKTPNLGEHEGEDAFKASYVKMKQDAVIDAIDTFEKAPKFQKLWEEHVRAIRSPTTWNASYAFGPDEAPGAVATTIKKGFVDGLSGNLRVELGEAVYGTTPKYVPRHGPDEVYQ